MNRDCLVGKYLFTGHFVGESEQVSFLLNFLRPMLPLIAYLLGHQKLLYVF